MVKILVPDYLPVKGVFLGSDNLYYDCWSLHKIKDKWFIEARLITSPEGIAPWQHLEVELIKSNLTNL